MSNGLQVLGIDAELALADMVDFEAFGNWPENSLVCHPVRELKAVGAVAIDSALVLAAPLAAEPNPAAILALVNQGKKALWQDFT
jgi:hypothetical protein